MRASEKYSPYLEVGQGYSRKIAKLSRKVSTFGQNAWKMWGIAFIPLEVEMKNQFRINIWVLITLIILTGTSVIDKVNQSQSDLNRSTEISLLNGKVNKLEVEQNKNRQNVTESLERFRIRIWNVEDNVKLQNEFMQIEYDNYQKYYLSHWKKANP